MTPGLSPGQTVAAPGGRQAGLSRSEPEFSSSTVTYHASATMTRIITVRPAAAWPGVSAGRRETGKVGPDQIKSRKANASARAVTFRHGIQ